MAEPNQFEHRLAVLEQEVAKLKQGACGSGRAHNWLDRFTGAFKDDANFDEIVKLGKEYRASQRLETHG